VRCALQISQNTLHEKQISGGGSVHEEAELLYIIGNVGACEGEILQGSSEAAIE
jgi:hypothetical protein